MSSPPPKSREQFATSRPNLRALLTDDGSRTLINTETGDSFHSAAGAVAETRFVYLELSDASNRIHRGQATRILEIGLGTGLALLMTLDLAVSSASELTYHVVETDWLEADVLAVLEMEKQLQNPWLVERFLDLRRSNPSIAGEMVDWQPAPNLSVRIWLQDLRHWNPTADHLPVDSVFDAIYYDPFAPMSAPELWTTEVFGKMKQVLAKDGRLTTYSCSRVVRESMLAAGLDPSVVPGPPNGKRNALVATHRSFDNSG